MLILETPEWRQKFCSQEVSGPQGKMYVNTDNYQASHKFHDERNTSSFRRTYLPENQCSGWCWTKLYVKTTDQSGRSASSKQSCLVKTYVCTGSVGKAGYIHPDPLAAPLQASGVNPQSSCLIQKEYSSRLVILKPARVEFVHKMPWK